MVSILAAVGVGALAMALRRHGLELADEGVLLAHMDRVAHGQVPYRDFHVGYGPALFRLEATLFEWFGASTSTVRTSLAIVHALRAAMLAGLAAALGGPRAAAMATVVLVGFFLPVAPGLCAPANVPYPAWFADLLGLAAVLVLAGGRERGAPLVVGVLWGLAFAFKQNSGILGLGAAATTLVLAAPRTAAGSRAAAVALAVALIGGALVLVHEHVGPLLAVVLVGPLLPLAVALGRARISRTTAIGLAGLLVGFFTVAGATVGHMIAVAGLDPVRTDFLQLGTDTARVYFTAYPTLAWLRSETAGLGWWQAVRITGDSAWFFVLPAVHGLAALMVARREITSSLGIGVAALAGVGFLAIYPRMDFWHLLPLAVPSLAALVLVGAHLGARLRTVAAVLLVLASVIRWLPTVPLLAAIAAPAAGGDRPVNERLDLRWDLVTDERLVHLPEVVEALAGRARVAGFPALGVVNFALGTPSPWRHDYFFPGRPGPTEEADLAREIAEWPPDAVVVLDATAGAFGEAFAAHPVVVEALRTRFVEQRRIGPYRILVPRGAQ